MLPEVRRSRLLQERALKSVRAHLISAIEPEVGTNLMELVVQACKV